MACLPVMDTIGELIFGDCGACGNLKAGMVRVWGGMDCLSPPFPLPFQGTPIHRTRYLRAIYALFNII